MGCEREKRMVGVIQIVKELVTGFTFGVWELPYFNMVGAWWLLPKPRKGE